jgi:hypothetical protein
MNAPSIVDKLFTTWLLLTCNEAKTALSKLCADGFFPTMKSQLSQLP